MTIPMRLLVCLLVAAFVSEAKAGSVFSFNGQGYPLRRLDSRSAGMGGAGRALVDGLNFASFNPALLGSFRRPGVTGRYALQRRNVEDIHTSESIADGDVDGIKTVFPFRFRGALSIGMEGLTDVDVTVVDSVGSGGEEHLLGLKGAGGVGAIVFGFGQKVGRKLFLGAQIDLMVVGTINETWTKDLLQDSQAFFSQDNITRSQKGAQFTFGGVYTPGNLSLAIVAKPKATVTQRVLLENRLTTNAITSSALEIDRDIQFPATIGFGLAYARSQRFIAAADVQFEAWGATGTGRHDAAEFAAGIQYQTQPDNALGGGRRLDLTAGVYHRSLYFGTASGEQITEFGATIGIGVPFQRQSGALRWSLAIGQRGDKQIHGARETFFRQTLSVSGWIQ